MVRTWLALVMALPLLATAGAGVDERGAAPDLDKVVGQPDRCYEPFAAGPSNVPGELVLAGTTSVAGASAATRRPFVLSVDFDGRWREVLVDDARVRSLEARGVARLDATTFVISGVGSAGESLALVDHTGRLEEVKNLATDVAVMGLERGSANDFLVYGRLGTRPYYASLNRSLAAIFERFPSVAAPMAQVLKARYSRARDAIWMVVQSVDAKRNPRVTLLKHDLLGNPVASTDVKAMYADFEETSDGVLLLYYAAAGDAQSMVVASFDKALKQRWVSEPLRARRGVIAPRVVLLEDEVLVVAADEFKLLLAGFDLSGRHLWTYRDPSSSVSPGSTYLIAHDGARLLLAQPDRRGGDATHGAPDPSCTRIRVVRFQGRGRTGAR